MSPQITYPFENSPTKVSNVAKLTVNDYELHVSGGSKETKQHSLTVL